MRKLNHLPNNKLINLLSTRNVISKDSFRIVSRASSWWRRVRELLLRRERKSRLDADKPRQNNMEMKQANERLKVMREKEAVALALEQAKIDEHARKRDEKEAMRRAHQKARMEDKRAAIQYMIDRATEHLAMMNDNANERLEQEVQAKRDADDEAARKKAEWRRKNWEACHRSRQGQIAAREEKKRIERKLMWRCVRDGLHSAALKEQERQERQDRRNRNIQVSNYILQQRESVSRKRSMRELRS